MFSLEQKQNLSEGFPGGLLCKHRAVAVPAGESSGQRCWGFSLLLGCRGDLGRTARAGCMCVLPDHGWVPNCVSLSHISFYKIAYFAESF